MQQLLGYQLHLQLRGPVPCVPRTMQKSVFLNKKGLVTSRFKTAKFFYTRNIYFIYIKNQLLIGSMLNPLVGKCPKGTLKKFNFGKWETLMIDQRYRNI